MLSMYTHPHVINTPLITRAVVFFSHLRKFGHVFNVSIGSPVSFVFPCVGVSLLLNKSFVIFVRYGERKISDNHKSS